LSPSELPVVPVPRSESVWSLPRLALVAVSPSIHCLFLSNEKSVTPLILLKRLCTEAVSKWGVLMIHDGLKPGRFRCLSFVRPSIELWLPIAFVRVVTATLTITEASGGLEESSRATVFRTDISEHRPRTHVHTRVEEQPVRLLAVGRPILELELGDVAHIPGDHVGLWRGSGPIVGGAGAFHDDGYNLGIRLKAIWAGKN